MADKKICHFYKKNLIKFCDLKKNVLSLQRQKEKNILIT